MSAGFAVLDWLNTDSYASPAGVAGGAVTEKLMIPSSDMRIKSINYITSQSVGWGTGELVESLEDKNKQKTSSQATKKPENNKASDSKTKAGIYDGMIVCDNQTIICK